MRPDGKLTLLRVIDMRLTLLNALEEVPVPAAHCAPPAEEPACFKADTADDLTDNVELGHRSSPQWPRLPEARLHLSFDQHVRTPKNSIESKRELSIRLS